MTETSQPGSLRSRLSYEPQELQFGTSGRRGKVVHLTQLEIYINALADLEYLQSLPLSRGGIARGEEFYFAYDLRPSSSRYVEEQDGRGEIAQAIESAIGDAGMQPVNLGCLPTPALTCYALARGRGSMMITGSHIPFDRNGYKTNTAVGELRKQDEEPIFQRVRQVRARLYNQPYAESPFDQLGLFKVGHRELLPATHAARSAYIERYASFFAGASLDGKLLLVYQHSAVGRDILVEILEHFGAEVIPAGRSERFVPIDTENIDAAQLAEIQRLADQAALKHGPLYAILSTDGDSDRPLILGRDPATAKVHFFTGDLVGMIVAEYLGTDAVVVPISCNDAIDRGNLAEVAEPKTRIGSPYVIAAMEKARSRGGRVVCGWEANGGFLTGSDIRRNGRVLKALPTRDALLPILSVLFRAHERGLTLTELFAQLPKRFSRAALLKRFPRSVGLEITGRFSPAGERVREAVFAAGGTALLDADRNELPISKVQVREVEAIRNRLGEFFTPAMGFGEITRLNYIDGVRISFSNGDVAHLRPSGNADELRLYVVADTEARAEAIAKLGVAEPDGILRRMEKAVKEERFGGSRNIGSGVLVLKGAVQHYEWGGYEFIPGLLGLENKARKPFAELWIGAHPSAPSKVVGRSVTLDKLLERSPEAILGPAVASRFTGRLPYLLKVLDARKMLSIQAHPNKHQAEEGFRREDAAGISLRAAGRNYKDDNHKPEVQVALAEMWMLHGFRPLEEIAATLRAVPELTPVMPDFDRRLVRAGQDADARRELLRELYGAMMRMPQERVDAILQPLTARLSRQRPRDKHSPDYWALGAAEDFPLPHGHSDRGIFSVYLLNLVHLRPGQGTFQPAGVLHAYLGGINVELMANSDNVLRGGLTRKRVDMEELMRILSFESGAAGILDGDPISAAETVYRTSAEEFELSRIEMAAGTPPIRQTACGPDSLMVIAGLVTITSQGRTLTPGRGQAILIPHAVDYVIETAAAPALLFKASIRHTPV